MVRRRAEEYKEDQIILFEAKALSEVSEDDLNDLVHHRKVREYSMLEYKEEMYGRSGSEIFEMLCDITAMANAHGGLIIIGVSEDKVAGDGTPADVVGIPNGDEEATRIENICLSCISERIQGLQVVDRPLSNGKSVVIIYIPDSTRKPHMITYKGKNQFWKRHERQKQKMSVEEIRHTVLVIEDYMQTLEEFLKRRKGDLLEAIGDDFWMLISATPVFAKSDKIDIFDKKLELLMISPPFRSRSGRSVSCGAPRPSLYGLRAEKLHRYAQTGYGSYLEVHRNGHVEFGVSLQHTKKESADTAETAPVGYIPSGYAAEYIVSFCYFAKDLFQHFETHEPIVSRLGFYNAEGVTLWHRRKLLDSDIVYWRKKHLEIPLMQISRIANPEQTAKILIDRLYNAFGLRTSSEFDSEGSFVRG